MTPERPRPDHSRSEEAKPAKAESPSAEDIAAIDAAAAAAAGLEAEEALRAEIARLEAERDDAIAARQRALADFANFQRRSRENEIRAHQGGIAGAVRSLLAPLDHFDLALEQDTSRMNVEQFVAGMRMVREEIAKALEGVGVSPIIPERGDEFDPHRHEAMIRQPAPDLPANHITRTLQPGYAMGDLVLRPAKVAVSGE